MVETIYIYIYKASKETNLERDRDRETERILTFLQRTTWKKYGRGGNEVKEIYKKSSWKSKGGSK